MKQADDIEKKRSVAGPPDLDSTNGRIIVFAVFFLLVFVFWYLDALGNEIEADIKYPIVYENIPESFNLDGMPQRMTLILDGTGYSMMKLKFTGKSNPVEIDFSKIRYYISDDTLSGEFYFSTIGMINVISGQIHPGCNIIDIEPDTLYFQKK